MNPENMQQRTPMDSANADKFDAKGQPRTQHDIDGVMFFGSEEEYTEELRARREEAKN